MHGCVQHSPTQSLQCPGVMPGLGYLGMAYGPTQRPVYSGMKQAITPLWTMALRQLWYGRPSRFSCGFHVKFSVSKSDDVRRNIVNVKNLNLGEPCVGYSKSIGFQDRKISIEPENFICRDYVIARPPSALRAQSSGHSTVVRLSLLLTCSWVVGERHGRHYRRPRLSQWLVCRLLGPFQRAWVKAAN